MIRSIIDAFRMKNKDQARFKRKNKEALEEIDRIIAEYKRRIVCIRKLYRRAKKEHQWKYEEHQH